MKIRLGKFKYLFLFLGFAFALVGFQNCGKSVLGGGAQIATVSSVTSNSDSPSDEPTTSEPGVDGPGVKNVEYCMLISDYSLNATGTIATYQGTFMETPLPPEGQSAGTGLAEIPEVLDTHSSNFNLVLTSFGGQSPVNLPLTILDDGTGTDNTTGRFSFTVSTSDTPVNLSLLMGTFTLANGYSYSPVYACPNSTQ